MTRNVTFLFMPRPDREEVSAPAHPAGAGDAERQSARAQSDDPTYLQSRADEEVARARRAANPAIAAVHYELAGRYLERLSRARPAE